ncbi:hypothetical protein EDC01DRAFT_626600 [Geopyxis carbonaria]|nr:hypothetical protein EDC01DRAFT_626600 [Geopyxis carbonaria]
MHGTYVNGLQLHHEETAELQDGTEITFGADVTRGDEVFPAKTFRVGVQWQRLHRPGEQSNTIPDKPRMGYGVSSPDLMNSEYDSNDEEDNEDYEEDGEHHSDDEKMTTSSGRSSSPAGSLHSDIMASNDQFSTYSSHRDIKSIGDFYDSKSSKLKQILERPDVICIDDDAEPSNKAVKSRPRMPSIPSLVNKPQSDEEVSAKKPTVETIVETETEVKIIEKPSMFDHNPSLQSEKKGGASQPICVDDDDDSEDENTEYRMDAESGEESEDQESIDNDEDDMEEENDIDDTMEEIKQSPNEQKVDTLDAKTDAANDYFKPAIMKYAKFPVPVAESTSDSTSPPDVMSSRLSDMFWHASNMMEGSTSKNTREVPSLPPLDGFTPVSTTRTTTGGYHTHWSGMTPPTSVDPKPYMTTKRDYFDARASNMAAINAAAINALRSGSRPTVSWNDNRPSLKPWPETHYGYSPANKACPYVPVPATEKTSAKDGMYSRSRVEELLEVSKAVEKDASKATQNETSEKPTKETPVEKTVDEEEEEEEELVETTDEEAFLNTDVFGDDELAYYGFSKEEIDQSPQKKPVRTKLDETMWPYGKLSINDMMNHESPKVNTTSAPFASPPPSENSAGSPVSTEKTKSGTALDSILNPENSNTGSGQQSLKRKHSRISHVEIPATPNIVASDYPAIEAIGSEEGAVINDAPEVVSTHSLFPELVNHPEVLPSDSDSPEVSEVEERSPKRVKTENKAGRGIASMAAAAVAGAFIGGVGVFAALVASAQ